MQKVKSGADAVQQSTGAGHRSAQGSMERRPAAVRPRWVICTGFGSGAVLFSYRSRVRHGGAEQNQVVAYGLGGVRYN